MHPFCRSLVCLCSQTLLSVLSVSHKDLRFIKKHPSDSFNLLMEKKFPSISDYLPRPQGRCDNLACSSETSADCADFTAIKTQGYFSVSGDT